MADYKVETRLLNGSKTVVVDLREDGVLVISASGDAKEIAINSVISTLRTRVEVGKKSERALEYIERVKGSIL
jgi:hypothetical protein